MALLSSPYRASRAGSASPLPPPPPPKAIDLNSSTRSTDRETGHKITRRAFHCDLVLEDDAPETADLVALLGQPIEPISCLPAPTTSARPSTPPAESHSPQKQDEKRYSSLVEELVKTEKSYLSRLRALKINYADPLREFAKDRNTQIIPLYEAKNLFSNIDQVVNASAAFLSDLEAMAEAGDVYSVADICLRHLVELPTFAPYRVYLGKQDEAQKLFQETLKKHAGFGTFIDSTKYRTMGIGNIGLRELLMEPVQRIPRYTLLWSTMAKCLAPMSPIRSKLQQAVQVASRIAACEPDAQTIRATVMYCMQRHVEDFPADLFSSKRNYIDSLDVEDYPSDYQLPSPGSSRLSRPTSTFSTLSTSTPSLASVGSTVSSNMPMSPGGHVAPSTLHCTLFLLDDKLIIVKRQTSGISGRRVTGLDNVAKLVKSGGGVAVMDKGIKKDKLVYKGAVDILDVIAADTGNGDFHLFFERPPADQSDRWSGRPFRAYSAVNPQFGGSLDEVAVRQEKLRFLQNLWSSQAMARAKLLAKEPSAYKSDVEVGLESAGELFGRAACFWSLWQRSDWDQLPRKAKVVVQLGAGKDIPLDKGTCLSFRLQMLQGGMVRVLHTAGEGMEQEIVDMTEVMDRIVTTTHQYGVFRFRSSNSSNPVTPSVARLRPSMLNLDTISRNLFGSSVSGRSSIDMFSPEPIMEKEESRNGSPAKPVMGQSEIDLNERLNLARRNSKSMAALSPRSSKRMAQKSMVELRGRSAEPLGTMDLGIALPTAIKDVDASLSTKTAPLHIRNKTPSPTRTLASTLELPPIPTTSPLMVGEQPLSPLSPTLGGAKSPVLGARLPGVGGPRPSPGRNTRPLPAAPIGIGSAHTRLRVVSGNGRRVSAGRATIPLKGSPAEEKTPTMLSKRQHSEDHLTPRKRSGTYSPLAARDGEQVAEPLAVPSGSGPPSRRPSHLSPHDAAHGSSRKAQPTTEVMVEHLDLFGAIVAARLQVAAAQEAARDILAEVMIVKKSVNKTSTALAGSMTGSLTRSPHKRNMNRLLDVDDAELDSPGRSVTGSLKKDVVEGHLREISGAAERLEGCMRVALNDLDGGTRLANGLFEDLDQAKQRRIDLEALLVASRQTEELLRQQLADAQVEVDTIYEAFNTELDGLFADAQLPVSQAWTTLQESLKSSMNERNSLKLENERLQRELQQARLQIAQQQS